MQEGTPIIIKKKKVHGHAHHGGAWKVAYADFVTAMMAFFMVMWIMSLSAEDRNVIQAYFKDPVGFSRNQPLGSTHVRPQTSPPSEKEGQKDVGNTDLAKQIAAKAEIDKVKNEVEKALQEDPALRDMLEKKSVNVNVTSEGLEIEFIENDMNGEVFFKVGSAEVRPQAKVVIGKIAPILAATDHVIIVEGHTDARPYDGNGYDNYDLSFDRANTVRHLLGGGGVKSEKFQEVVAYADQRPRVVTDPYHFSNRRVTVLLPFGEPASKQNPGVTKTGIKESIEGIFRNPVGIKR